MTNVLAVLIAAGGFGLLVMERHAITTGILLTACFLISLGMWLLDSALLTGFFSAIAGLIRARHGDEK